MADDKLFGLNMLVVCVFTLEILNKLIYTNY